MFKKLGKYGRSAKFLVNTALLASAGMVAAAVHDSDTAWKTVEKYEKSRGIFADETANVALGDATMSIVVAAVTMGVGAMILSKIFPSIIGSDSTANSTIETIKNTTWDALVLLPIALIVFASVVIIGVVMYLRQ